MIYNKKGFSLIETTISIFLLTIIVGGLISAIIISNIHVKEISRLDKLTAKTQLIVDILLLEVPEHYNDIAKLEADTGAKYDNDLTYDSGNLYKFSLLPINDTLLGITGYTITVQYNDNKSHISLSAFACIGG